MPCNEAVYVRVCTFIFPDILQSKGQVRVFSLDDADLTEGASADDS